MRVLKRISGLVLSLCLAGTIALPAMAAQKESYTYQVRFLAGAQGAFNPGGKRDLCESGRAGGGTGRGRDCFLEQWFCGRSQGCEK